MKKIISILSLATFMILGLSSCNNKPVASTYTMPSETYYKTITEYSQPKYYYTSNKKIATLQFISDSVMVETLFAVNSQRIYNIVWLDEHHFMCSLGLMYYSETLIYNVNKPESYYTLYYKE